MTQARLYECGNCHLIFLCDVPADKIRHCPLCGAPKVTADPRVMLCSRCGQFISEAGIHTHGCVAFDLIGDKTPAGCRPS